MNLLEWFEHHFREDWANYPKCCLFAVETEAYIRQQRKIKHEEWVMLLSKESMKDVLKLHNCQVTFTKKDGTKRVMQCTLRSDVIVPYEKKTDRTKIDNPDLIAVWDLEANAWRSFQFSSVIDFIVSEKQ